LTPAESPETTRIYSAMGRLPADEPLLTRRPFRTPRHTISDAGMVGGGSTPAPGEVSVAHHGMLFLDEPPECLRTPTPGMPRGPYGSWGSRSRRTARKRGPRSN
jgi:predicted ATPase with chaperone activity